MYICVIDGGLILGFNDRVKMLFPPLETRSGHEAENRQPAPRSGRKKNKKPRRFQNSAPI